MAEQNMSEVIPKAVAEATKIAIQTMAEIQVSADRQPAWTQTRQSCPKTTYIQLGSNR